ncbi:glycosyltransferase family 32 protein [Kozakia baliensis]|uniref:glycosyltransferase family 32 protein n=1 Tax=Kozakia baliensis TaxID=153496 RepID=UPI0013626CE8|nr:glycosyltransferase [Kozakia baliensis]
MADYLETVPKWEQMDEIPKKIYFIYFGTSMNKLLTDNIEDLKKKNPDYEVSIISNEEVDVFIKENYGEIIYKYYNRINPIYAAAKSDFARYLLIYALGGIYLDNKSSFSVPISKSIKGDEGFVIAQWMNEVGQIHEGTGIRPALAGIPYGEYQQWHIIAAKGHPFLRNAIAAILYEIDHYRPWRHLVGRIGVLNVTGPLVFTNSIAPIRHQHKHVYFRYNEDLGLVYNNIAIRSDSAINHYSKYREPIVRVNLMLKFLNNIHKIFLKISWHKNGKVSLPNKFF